MPIMSMDKDKMIWFCPCGAKNTYKFNYAGINSKQGPFNLSVNDSLTIRFDNTRGNAGTIETITFAQEDFANWNVAISVNDIVQKLNQVLQAGIAINDFGSVLIESKTSGPFSCVEIIDGTARAAFGYDVRGGDPEVVHHGCERLFLGYCPIPEKQYTDVILLRRCSNCTGQSSIFRNHIDFSNTSPVQDSNFFRKASNSLAKYLQDNGWVDVDLEDFYAQNPYSPPEFFSDFPDSPIDIAALAPAKFQ